MDLTDGTLIWWDEVTIAATQGNSQLIQKKSIKHMLRWVPYQCIKTLQMLKTKIHCVFFPPHEHKHDDHSGVTLHFGGYVMWHTANHKINHKRNATGDIRIKVFVNKGSSDSQHQKKKKWQERNWFAMYAYRHCHSATWGLKWQSDGHFFASLWKLIVAHPQ